MKKFSLMIMALLGCNVLAQPLELPASGFGDVDTIPVNESYVNEKYIGDAPLETILNYRNNTKYWQISRSVGLLDILVSRDGTTKRNVCTATLIGNDLILTNHHCIPGNSNAQVTAALLHMGYDQVTSDVRLYPVDPRPLETNDSLDYTILSVGNSPGERWGHVTLNVRPPRANERVFIIQHPKGEPKQISRNCPLLAHSPFTGSEIRHRCDTFGGSSGSLVFSELDGSIIGLHFAGYRWGTPASEQHNRAKRLDAIFTDSAFLPEQLPSINPASRLISTSEELVRRAAQGGRLELAAVTFRLSAPLELRGDVQLIGQGYERTRIVSSAREAVVRYRGGGTFTARGVGFARDGGEGDVVRVADGNVAIDACQFMGGVGFSNNYFGAGITLKGNSRGTIRNSQVNNNNYGIRYTDSAAGSAVGNEIFSNNWGISVSNDAKPQLEQDRIYENEYSGILYKDSAAGSAVGNEIFGNDSGIYVWNNAKPQLEQNRIHDNQASGISYEDSAAGSASNNQIYNNGLNPNWHGAGIRLRESANPTLSNNTFYGNRQGAIQDGR